MEPLGNSGAGFGDFGSEYVRVFSDDLVRRTLIDPNEAGNENIRGVTISLIIATLRGDYRLFVGPDSATAREVGGSSNSQNSGSSHTITEKRLRAGEGLYFEGRGEISVNYEVL